MVGGRVVKKDWLGVMGGVRSSALLSFPQAFSISKTFLVELNFLSLFLQTRHARFMKYLKIIFLFFLIIVGETLNGQSFEGVLTYKVTFEIKSTTFNDQMKEAVINKMKEEGEYYDSLIITIKGGNYIKEDNSGAKKKIIYKQQENQLFSFTGSSEFVTIVDAKKRTLLQNEYLDPKVKKSKVSETILGKKLKSITLAWKDLGEEVYYYNSEFLTLNPYFFQNHNYEFLNTVLSTTESYPVQVIKSVNNFITIKMTLISYKENSLDDALFKIPKLEKVDTEYAKSVYEVSGNQIMKIIN